MKKLFTIITLLMSSFFLFSINEVKADVFEYELNSELINYITDDFLKLREETIKYCQENNTNYLIVYENNQYISYISSFSSYRNRTYQNKPRFTFNTAHTRYILNNNTLTLLDSGTNYDLIFHDDLLGFNLLKLMDTNLQNLFVTESHSYILKYNDTSYEINSTVNFPTLYSIYLEHNSTTDDTFTEEKELINNFYLTIADKIVSFANNFITNYIFILILGIFVLIFVFELIWRRFI